MLEGPRDLEEEVNMDSWYRLMLECDCKHKELLREAERERLAKQVLKARRAMADPAVMLPAAATLALGLAAALAMTVL